MWLSPGPGTSALRAVFTGLGPYSLSTSNAKRVAVEVSYKNSSWTNEYNMLFLDNLPESGFSFTSDEIEEDSGESGIETKTEEELVDDLLEVLNQFFKAFPDFKNGVYFAGEGYAGMLLSNTQFANVHLERSPMRKACQ